jgi:Fur family ferric uptake transcriptional regulator
MELNVSLKRAGLKATLPRLKVLAIFSAEQDKHLSAEAVYKRLLADGEEIGLATIYRVLTQCENAGLLIRHHFESGKAVFEFNRGHHHDHLVCIQCGRVVEFYDEVIERRQQEIAHQCGFSVKEHALYLYVNCLDRHCPHRKNAQDV